MRPLAPWYPGAKSPWGTVQHAEPCRTIPGAYFVSTASHGGLWLPPKLRGDPRMPKGWRQRAWFEEDCAYAVAECFLGTVPDNPSTWRQLVRDTVARWYPDIPLPPY